MRRRSVQAAVLAAAAAYLVGLVFYPGLNPAYCIAWAVNADLSAKLTDAHHAVDFYSREKGSPPDSLQEALAFLRGQRPGDKRLTRIASVAGHLYYSRLDGGYVLFSVGSFPQVSNNTAAYLNHDFYRCFDAFLHHEYLLSAEGPGHAAGLQH